MFAFYGDPAVTTNIMAVLAPILGVIAVVVGIVFRPAREAVCWVFSKVLRRGKSEEEVDEDEDSNTS